MNISGIKGSEFATEIAATNSNQNRAPSSIPPAPGAPAASTKISGPGQLFSRLQQLAEKDPAKFKEVAQGIADQMHQAAQQASGKGADMENQLADKFAQAAQSGDMSPFRPPQHQPGADGAQAHHHHHHHGGGAAGGSNSMASVLSNALDQVNQALNGGASTTPAVTTP